MKEATITHLRDIVVSFMILELSRMCGIVASFLILELSRKCAIVVSFMILELSRKCGERNHNTTLAGQF
jgi:hypothetical protein